MKHIQITFCIVALLISSCRNKNVKTDRYNPNVSDLREMIRIENNKPFVVYPDNATETDLSEDKNLCISKQKVVPLDSKKGKIGDITKVMVHKDRIYIVDETKNNDCIFVYDTLGHCVNKIDKRGKGPGEYVAIQSVMIDTLRDRIILQDQHISQVLFYDLDGNFKDQKKLTFYNNKMDLLGQKYIYYTSYGQNFKNSVFDNYSLVTGTIDKIYHYGFERQPCERNMWVTSILNKNFKNDLLYKPSFSDSIYHIISDSTYSLHSIFKFKKSMFEKCSQYKTLSMSQVDEFVRDYHGVWSLGFYESKDFIFFRCAIGKRVNNFIYSKNKNECYEVKFTGIYGSINESKYIFEMPCASNGDMLISIAQPYDVIEKYNMFKQFINNPSEVPITELVESIKISDNPLVIFSKFETN